MIYTTLNKIREHKPCKGGWEKLLAHLGKTKADNEPLPLLTILDSNGLDDCLWSLRTVPEHAGLWRKYAVWCARQVEYLIVDERSKQALDVAWRHAEGKATNEELDAAALAAEAAADAAAWAAAREAVWSARAAREAADAAAWAAREAAWAAADAAAWAAREAAWAAWAAREAAEAAQETKLRTILSAGEWV